MRRTPILVAALVAALLAACARQAVPTVEPEALGEVPAIGVAAAPAELFFSEYIEGASNNKALEIFNGTGAAVDLAAGSYSVQMFFNGSTSAGLTINLTGTVADGDVFVLANSAANATILAQADQTNGAGWYNGDDAVVLRKGTTVIDVIGQIGFDPGSEWGTGLTSTADNTLRRKAAVRLGDPDGSNAFDPSVEWDGFATNDAVDLGVGPIPRLNEFVANHVGTDTYEYVEVAFAPTMDLSAFTILVLEGDAGAPGAIDAAFTVGTTSAAGLWTTGYLSGAIENGSMTLLLVEGFAGSVDDDLDADDDGVLDTTPWTWLVDAVAVDDGGVDARHYASTVLAGGFDGVAFTPGGASRIPDRTGGWVRNDFDLAGIAGFTGSPELGEALNTPGAANAVVETPPPPPPACSEAFTPIFAIQGSGATAAITGAVTTKGVVVGDYEGASPNLRGFYIHDATGDGDPATSDGIFVFNGNNDNVALGDLVVVSGTAGEFQDQTQISNVTSITFCASDASVTPVDVALPVASTDFLERYEGMLVRFTQTLYVTEHFQLGRFGQVVVSSGDRLWQPTQVAEPGAAALALQADNNLNRLIIDDALNNQNPDPIVFGRDGDPLSATNTLRGGDTVTNPVGVLTYTWAGNSASPNAYRLRPIGALGGFAEFVATNPRPTDAPVVGGALQVGTFNLLNYFNTFDGIPDNVDNCTNGVGGVPTDCRGADTADEFVRQADKTVAAILGMDVAVLGVTELENDGYGATSAIADLVDRLNAVAGAGTWAFIDADAGTGMVNALGVDAIKVGLLYQPDLVTPVGTTAALNTDAFVNGGDSESRNRPALAQAFQDDDGVFIAVVNHLKSKGSACTAPDAGDGQGNCNEVRTNAALELATWLATDPTGTGDPDVLIMGDLNSYAMEDPIAALEDAGYTNLLPTLVGSGAYGYVFDGQWGTLDHALASATLDGQVSGAASWHINADEPSVLDYNTNFKSAGQIVSLYGADAYRTSDHDPVVVGLDLSAAPVCAAAAPSIAVLWPPQHQFVGVDIYGVTDPDGDTVTISIVSVFQDEPVDAPGDADGSTAPDATGIGAATVQLRAERDETGNGRYYHVTFQATDTFGQTCTGTVRVSVPKSQGKKGAAVDDGALYDATLE